MSSCTFASVSEAAQIIGVTPQTITNGIRSRDLAAEKVGRSWIIERGELEAYLKRNNLCAEPKDHPIRKKQPGPTALSFFSGALGLDLGMENAGIHASLLCESDRKCRMTIESMRHDPALIGDITKYDAQKILSMAGLEPGGVDIMFGGPPCQAFSTAGARRAFDDVRGNVFLKYIDLASEIKPRYLVIENVRGLLSTSYPTEPGGPSIKGGALRIILNKLKEAGYAVSFNLYNAANFGAPQVRERVVLIGKLGTDKVGYLVPTNSNDPRFGLPGWITFGQAVKGLPKECHAAEFPAKRLKFFKMLKEGQYWKDLPADMQPIALGKAYNLGGGKTGFYRRIRFDKPCPTLVTSPTMPATDLCHPVEDRPLSIEEYKRVQGFPDDWEIRGNLSDIYRQIGNAVPVALGEAIGKLIIDDMNGVPSIPPAPDFPYSRYRKTSDSTWSIN